LTVRPYITILIDATEPRTPSWEEAGFLTEVVIGENDSFEAALRRFSKKVQHDGILSEARRRERFEKPSVRRKKKEAAKRRKSGRAARGSRES
jgi:small subunit ribosomal protein S21